MRLSVLRLIPKTGRGKLALAVGGGGIGVGAHGLHQRKQKQKHSPILQALVKNRDHLGHLSIQERTALYHHAKPHLAPYLRQRPKTDFEKKLRRATLRLTSPEYRLLSRAERTALSAGGGRKTSDITSGLLDLEKLFSGKTGGRIKMSRPPVPGGPVYDASGAILLAPSNKKKVPLDMFASNQLRAGYGKTLIHKGEWDKKAVRAFIRDFQK